jgi:hypothetical protein
MLHANESEDSSAVKFSQPPLDAEAFAPYPYSRKKSEAEPTAGKTGTGHSALHIESKESTAGT